MRRGNVMRLNGIDAKFLTREEVIARWIPNLDCSEHARFPILGGLLQPRGGTVRHDAVAWGYARGADRARCRHHPAVRGDGHPDPRWRHRRRRDHAGLHRDAEARPRRRRALESCRRMAGLRASHRVARAAGDRLRAGEAGARHRRLVRRRALLRLPVRQGRPGDGQRPRQLQFLRPARRPAGDRGDDGGREGAHAASVAVAHSSASGAASWT